MFGNRLHAMTNDITLSITNTIKISCTTKNNIQILVEMVVCAEIGVKIKHLIGFARSNSKLQRSVLRDTRGGRVIVNISSFRYNFSVIFVQFDTIQVLQLNGILVVKLEPTQENKKTRTRIQRETQPLWPVKCVTTNANYASQHINNNLELKIIYNRTRLLQDL